MWLKYSWLALLLGCQAGLASPVVKARSAYRVKERHFVPNRWTHIGSPDPDKIINLQIGLKQGNFEELERHLLEGTVYRSEDWPR